MVKVFRIDKFKYHNDGSRDLLESVFVPEVHKALIHFIKVCDANYVLIGGLATSFYNLPRYTQDIDVLFLTFDNIPIKLNGFKRTSEYIFKHNKTNIEVKILIPSINLREDLAKSIIETSIVKNGVKIASPGGLIVSKLGRFNKMDQYDIEELIKYQKVDLSAFNLTEEELLKYNYLKDNLT